MCKGQNQIHSFILQVYFSQLILQFVKSYDVANLKDGIVNINSLSDTSTALFSSSLLPPPPLSPSRLTTLLLPAPEVSSFAPPTEKSPIDPLLLLLLLLLLLFNLDLALLPPNPR